MLSNCRVAKRMDKKLRDRLVGGFGGAGGTFVLDGIFVYASAPSLRGSWWLWLTIESIGIILVAIAVYFHFKKITVTKQTPSQNIPPPP
jgi:hypothetical protein